MLMETLRKGEGLIQLLALSVVMLLCWFGILLRDVMHAVLLVSYMLVVVRSTSEGRLEPPEPSADKVGGTFSALLRLMVASWSIWAPLMLVYTFVGDAGVPFMVVLLFALVSFPSAVLLTALGNSLVALFNPITMVRTVSRLGFRYWQAAGVFCLSILGIITISANLGGWLAYQPLPFIGDILLIITAHTVQVGLLTVGAFSVGWTAFEAGDRLSLWTEQDLICAQVPDANPRGASVRRLEDRIDDELDVDIELTQNDPLPISPSPASVQAMVVDVETYDIEDLPEDTGNIELALSMQAPETLKAALESHDVSRVIELYDSIVRASGAEPSLPPAQQLRLADCLVEASRYQAAAAAYRLIAQSNASHRLAPVAILRLATLLSEHLNRADMATTLLRLLEKKYPDFKPRLERGRGDEEGTSTEHRS